MSELNIKSQIKRNNATIAAYIRQGTIVNFVTAPEKRIHGYSESELFQGRPYQYVNEANELVNKEVVIIWDFASKNSYDKEIIAIYEDDEFENARKADIKKLIKAKRITIKMVDTELQFKNISYHSFLYNKDLVEECERELKQEEISKKVAVF